MLIAFDENCEENVIGSLNSLVLEDEGSLVFLENSFRESEGVSFALIVDVNGAKPDFSSIFIGERGLLMMHV